jgi:hypothetical protein
MRYAWVGPLDRKTYEELEATDPIGFEEFNAIIAHALAAADAA